MFEEKVVKLQVKNYRAQLPCDWYETIQVRESKVGNCLRWSSDSFALEDNPKAPADDTIKIQGDIIYLPLKEGEIEMSYRAIKLDDDGLPMIIDNSNFYRAAYAYIKKEKFTILFDLDKISGTSLQQALIDYAWAVGSLETDLRKLDLSKAENFYNSYRTLIVRDSEFARGFKNNGSKEYLKVQS